MAKIADTDKEKEIEKDIDKVKQNDIDIVIVDGPLFHSSFGFSHNSGRLPCGKLAKNCGKPVESLWKTLSAGRKNFLKNFCFPIA